MNHLTIIGNLTADPEKRATATGKQVVTFTVAVNRRKTAANQNPVADFFRVNAWEELGINCANYLSKGRKVAVTGSVSVSTYTTQNGEFRASLEVMAKEVEFLTPKDSTPSGYTQVNPDDNPFGA